MTSLVGRWLHRLLALVVLTPAQVTSARAEECPAPTAPPVAVAAVTDARTVTLTDGRLVRPAGVESFALLDPERTGSDEALAADLKAVLGAASVAVMPITEKPDRHGRLPALLFLPDGRLVQGALAARGHAVAWSEEPALPCFSRILAAEAEARDGHLGGWTGRWAQVPAPGPAAIEPFVGGFTIFEGKVVTVGARPARTYLNFGGRWSEDVTVTIAARDREALGGEAALAALKGRRVRVRGFVEEHGGPEIAVRFPGQLEVLPPGNADVAEKP